MSSKYLRVISVIIGIFGVIFGIILGATCKINTSEWYSSARYIFNTGLMFETWIVFDLIVLLFNWCAAVLGKLENIEKAICGEDVNCSETTYKKLFSVASERIRTATNVYNNADSENPNNHESVYNNESISNNEWKCPSCGKINQNYTGTCGCGQQKPIE